MEIRAANLDDVVAISELISSLTEKFIACDCSEAGAQRLLGSMTPDAIKNYMESGYRYHVAESNNVIIGVVAIKNNSHLYHLFVAESEQKKGYSRCLWKAAKEACIAEGNSGEFTVNSSINAQELYKS